MFEPTTLPTATSGWPRRAAMTDVMSSGTDVPTATIVKPTTRSLIPRTRAAPTALDESLPRPGARAQTDDGRGHKGEPLAWGPRPSSFTRVANGLECGRYCALAVIRVHAE